MLFRSSKKKPEILESIKKQLEAEEEVDEEEVDDEDLVLSTDTEEE